MVDVCGCWWLMPLLDHGWHRNCEGFDSQVGFLMEIGLCQYHKGTDNKWIYDVTDHLMVDFFLNDILYIYI